MSRFYIHTDINGGKMTETDKKDNIDYFTLLNKQKKAIKQQKDYSKKIAQEVAISEKMEEFDQILC